MGSMKDLLGDQPFDLFNQNYRNTDPWTSKLAGESAKEFRGRQHKGMLRIMAQHDRPMSAEEISDKANFQCWRRMSELKTAGLIVEANVKPHKGRSNRPLLRYQLTELGRLNAK